MTMKKFRFEITLTEKDVSGDEFWDEALQKDGTGIQELREVLASAIEDTNILAPSKKTGRDVVKLVEYKDVEGYE